MRHRWNSVAAPLSGFGADKKACPAARLLGCALLVLAAAVSAAAADVKLAWDANTDPGLAGYNVYYGAQSRVYSTSIKLGLQTTCTVTGLPPGTYYFAVTAYNTAGLESGYSNEVSTTVTYSKTSKFDLNGDGAVDVLDLQLLTNVILGAPCAGTCDLNGDGVVNVLDLQLMTNAILGVGITT